MMEDKLTEVTQEEAGNQPARPLTETNSVDSTLSPQPPTENIKIHDMTNGKSKKSRKPLVIILSILAVLIMGGIALIIFKTDKATAPAEDTTTAPKSASISTYEECIKQTGAIMEQTSPVRCIYAGKTYVQAVAEKPAEAPKVVDPLADWKTFTAKSKSFTVRYPKEYLARDCSEDGNASYFGASEALLAICNSGKTGQNYFGAVPKAEFTMASLKRPANSSYEKDYKYEDVTVNGKAMIKTTSTLKAGEMTEEGTKIVTYDYVAGSTHFSAAYQQKPSETDNLATFEQMVKTWTIK